MNILENVTPGRGLSIYGGLVRWLAERSALQRWLLGGLAWVVVVALGYAEENWRANRDWENYKQESSLKGIDLDWSANIPPPVPDEQNFFKVPNMQQWFTGRGGNSLSGRLSYNPPVASLKREEAVATLAIVPWNARVVPEDADVVLQFDYGCLSLSGPGDSPASNAAADVVIPLIVIDTVALPEAIRAVARQANIKLVVDGRVKSGPGLFASGGPEQMVSVRWHDLTARQALSAILKKYDLQMAINPVTGVARISGKDKSTPLTQMERNATRELGDRIREAFEAATNGIQAARLDTGLGFQLTAAPLGPMKPVRVVVRSDSAPDAEEIRNFFPVDPLGTSFSNGGSHVQVQADDDTNSFHIFISPQSCVSAADYLAWSDQLQPEFEEIREALKRPYARMEGDYEHSESIPIPNFVCLRYLAQTLGERAQAYLLLGQPEKALREITLLHDMSRIMEARPTGRPMTLVAAMINVAVTGLYVGIIADGLELHAWREGDLAAIQGQLRETDLEPYVAEAFKFEPACHARLLETKTPLELARLFTQNYKPSYAAPQSDDWKDPTYWYCLLVPRGWLRQNMAYAGRMEEKWADGFDIPKRVVRPKDADQAAREIDADFKRMSPFSVLARMMVPNATRATQVCAKNQTLVNEAYLACALERHRLARGGYPEKLDDLAPQFADSVPADVIGGKPLKYRVEGGGFVLYSVGWNETDEGGVVGFNRDGSGDLAKNDWVWPYGAEGGGKK